MRRHRPLSLGTAVRRAVVVATVRDGGQVALRLQVPWAEGLHARWMPGASMEEFLVRTTNQNSAAFARDLAQVERSVERTTRLSADHDAPRTFPRWQWPSSSEVQDALRRELMSRLADGAQFAHLSRLPASTELVLGREPAAIRLQLPDFLGPALLTVYRPTEQWLRPGQISAPTGVQRSVPR